MRSKARHDEAQALFNARRKVKLEIAKNLSRMDILLKKIIEATGLTREETEGCMLLPKRSRALRSRALLTYPCLAPYAAAVPAVPAA